MTKRLMDRLASWKGHKAASLIAHWFLGGVFIAAAYHKIVHPDEFALTVATYQILPLNLINLQAIGLPWMELLVGAALIIGIWTRESALVTVGMNIMFIVAIIIVLYRGEEIMCGCFASADAGHQIGWDLVLRDFGLIIIGVYLTTVGARYLSVDNALAQRHEVTHEEN